MISSVLETGQNAVIWKVTLALTLTLTDQDSNLIILGDDVDWECTLQFDVIDNNNPMNALDYRSKVSDIEYDEMEDSYNNVYSGDADIGEI